HRVTGGKGIFQRVVQLRFLGVHLAGHFLANRILATVRRNRIAGRKGFLYRLVEQLFFVLALLLWRLAWFCHHDSLTQRWDDTQPSKLRSTMSVSASIQGALSLSAGT